MKFDTNKVITRDNKSEAVVGQRYFFSDNRQLLESYVTAGKDEHTSILSAVRKEDGTYSFYDNMATSWRFVYPVAVEEEKFDKSKIISEANASDAIVGRRYFFADDIADLKIRIAHPLEADELGAAAELVAIDYGFRDSMIFKKSEGCHWTFLYPAEEVTTNAPTFNGYEILSCDTKNKAVVGQEYVFVDNLQTFASKDFSVASTAVLGEVAVDGEGVGDMVFRKRGMHAYWRYICPVGAFALHPEPPLGIKPRTIHDEQRRDEIIDACNRYIEAKKAIPYEWIEELFENYNRATTND